MERKSLVANDEAAIAESAPTMSQAMRTARHQNGGRCDPYEGRKAACPSGKSVMKKQIETKGQPRRLYFSSPKMDQTYRRGLLPC